MATTDYVTQQEMQQTLELHGTTFADLDLAVNITAASRAVDEYCGRRFYLDDDTTGVRYYTPCDGRKLLIDDIVTVATVQTDADNTGAYASTWVATTDYVMAPFNAAERSWPYDTMLVQPTGGQRFVSYERSVKITGRFGWPSVPAPVKQATIIMASRLLQRARTAPFGVIGAGLDAPAIRIPTVDPDVRMLLDPYQRGRGVLAA